jgi:hypothetical protein
VGRRTVVGPWLAVNQVFRRPSPAEVLAFTSGQFIEVEAFDPVFIGNVGILMLRSLNPRPLRFSSVTMTRW